MKGEVVKFINSPLFLKQKALKALERAKILEQNKLNAGKKYKRIDEKTWVLK